MKKDYDNCEYLNLLIDENFQENVFYDPDHLNRRGSEKLSIFVDLYLNKFLN